MHIHLDAVGGVAGDMFVAALLDAFPDLRDRVLDDAAAVLPDGVGPPRTRPLHSHGLTALGFGLPETRDGKPHGGPPSGTFAAIAARLAAAPLAGGTAHHATAILRVLAEAEARVHGVPVAKVHFHEIADWDSVMDVAAAGSVVAALDGATWSVSDLPRGGGFVPTRHGPLPVPAPATALILDGARWRDDGVDGERVTPTGAAILHHLGAAAATTRGGGRLVATGLGAGTRTLPGVANVLRVLAFRNDAAAGDGPAAETVAIVSFDVDDMTGEEIGVAVDRLRAEDGVLDVSLGTRLGKKGRPSHDIRVLLRPASLERVRLLCLHETSTIGLRWRTEDRVRLDRRHDAVAVDGRRIGVKRVARPDGGDAKAESDDLAVVPGLAARRRLKRRAEGET